MINCSHLSVSPTESTEWPVEGLRGRAGNSSSTGQVLTCQVQAAEHIGQEQSWRQKAQWQAQEREQIMTISQAVIHRKSFYPDTKPSAPRKEREMQCTQFPAMLPTKVSASALDFTTSLQSLQGKKKTNLFPQRLITALSSSFHLPLLLKGMRQLFIISVSFTFPFLLPHLFHHHDSKGLWLKRLFLWEAGKFCMSFLTGW